MRRECGAAVVMAMLVVALCAVTVSGAFLRQSVMARQVENGFAVSQARWLYAGALDWMRAILREDARASATDHLSEPWALPLAPTQISDDESDPAYLSGRIEDLQGRYNLRNLSGAGTPRKEEVAVLARLLAIVGAGADSAEPIALQVQSALSGTATPFGALLPGSIDDIVLATDSERAAILLLSPFVTLLPTPTPVNANTASAEVLSARFERLQLVDARRLIDSRDRAAFKDVTDVITRLPDLQLSAAPGTVAVATRYFLLEGKIEYRRAHIHQHSLLRREPGRVDIVWTRELRV